MQIEWVEKISQMTGEIMKLCNGTGWSYANDSGALLPCRGQQELIELFLIELHPC